ncbi:hypothetical protein FRB99_003459 [Tulasnella sp. 403]|nr:hypothetical protein FRB99_003459 [Tulasnella sp. 403]
MRIDQNPYYEIITGRIPYDQIDDYETLIGRIDQRILPAILEELDCPARVRNLLDLCWKWEPEDRPSINKIYGILSGQGFMFREEHLFKINDLASLKFSHDGKILAAGFKSSIILYDTETWKELKTLIDPSFNQDDDPSHNLYFMQFSRSGRFILSGTCQYNVLLWNLEDGKLHATFSGHTSFIWGLDISSDDAFLASGGQDSTLRFWDLNQTDRDPGFISLPGHLHAAAFAVGAQVLVIGIAGHGVWLINVTTGSIITKVDLQSTSTLRFSATGDWLVHSDDRGNITCWRTADLLPGRLKAEQAVPLSERKMHSPLYPQMALGPSFPISVEGDLSVTAWQYDGLISLKGLDGLNGTYLRYSNMPNAYLLNYVSAITSQL